jgi:Na+/proline symporter
MSATLLFTLFAIYFGILMLVTTLAGRKARSNEAFFLGNRQSPWWVVAIGMVGSSISGVSFISVPGMVGGIGFTYMQTVVGFFFGYIVVAKLLLPLYYKLQITSIYSYLNQRLGVRSYKTGASFFLLSKLIGASARLYVVALVLQTLVLNQWHIPFPLTVIVIVLLIWLYTFRSGMKSIV